MSVLQFDPIFGGTAHEFATFVSPKICMKDKLEYLRSKSYTSSRWSDRFITSLACLAMVTCAMALLMTVLVITGIGQKPEPPVDEPRRIIPHQVCMQCVKLFKDQLNQLEPDPLVDKLTKRVDDGFQMCCADSDDQLSALLEASLRKQVATPVSAFRTFGKRGKRSTALVHKQLLLNSELKSNLTGGKPFKWPIPRLFAKFNKDNDDTHTEHVRGVTVLDTALEIQHTGPYYVYLSVDLAPTSSKHSPKHKTWRHHVYLDRPESLPQTMTLLSVSDTQSNHLSHNRETTFLGGTFNLEKGDRLSVILGDLDLVQYKKESSYIGLFLLSN